MQYYEILDSIQQIQEDSVDDQGQHEISSLVKYLEQNRPNMLSNLLLNESFHEMTHVQCLLLGMQSVLDHIYVCGVPQDLERMVSETIKNI